MDSSPLKLAAFIPLPSRAGPRDYGRTAIHLDSARLYIPIVDEDALAVVDCNRHEYLHAIPNLPGVNAVVTSEQAELLLAAVPGASEVIALAPGPDRVVWAVPVGGIPEELAYDASRDHLLVAFADRRENKGYFGLVVVDARRQIIIGEIRVPGPTRQVHYDRQSDMFYVVVADPPQIVVLAGGSPTRVAHAFDVAASGVRGIAVGPQGTRLFCACDDSTLITIDRRSGRLLSSTATSGQPDTVLYDPIRAHVYVAIREAGTIEVFDALLMTSLGVVTTEPGAHRFTLDPARHRLYVLLPLSHQVAVYDDSW